MCYVLCCQLSFRMPNFLRNFEDNENLAMVLHKVTLRVLYTALYASGHITVVHKWVWVQTWAAQFRLSLYICFYWKIYNFYPMIMKLGQNFKVLMGIYLILREFHNHWVKIVYFLIKAYVLWKSGLGCPGLYWVAEFAKSL